MGIFQNSDYGSDSSFLANVKRAVGQSSDHNFVTKLLIIACVFLFMLTSLSDWLYVNLMFYTPIAGQQPWRFITSAFLHGGLLHIMCNMYALFLIGSQLERVMGKWRFILLYFGSAIAGNLAVYFLTPWFYDTLTATVGASGAVFGLFGALLVITRKVSGNISGILVLLAINFATSFILPSISWESHLGGLLGGIMITTFLIAIAKLQERRY